MKTKFKRVFKSGAVTVAAMLLTSCGVAVDRAMQPTFTLDAEAMRQIIDDWVAANKAWGAKVVVLPTASGQTLVATMPDGSVVTETVNPAGVVVK